MTGQLWLALQQKVYLFLMPWTANFFPKWSISRLTLRLNQMEVCIDLVLTSNEIVVGSVTACDPLGASHHSMLEIELISPTIKNATKELVPDY